MNSLVGLISSSFLPGRRHGPPPFSLVFTLPFVRRQIRGSAPVPMELGGGESAAKHARLSSGSGYSAAVAGKDRFSALPNDIVVLILGRLSTCGAARTSVLSHRWRRVWALLPALCFPYVLDPRQIGSVLEAHDAALLRLAVLTRDAGPESVAAWLPVAARRLSGGLLFRNTPEREGSAQEGDEEENTVLTECSTISERMMIKNGGWGHGCVLHVALFQMEVLACLEGVKEAVSLRKA